uniref:BZIP domain-containing protein n=1 Tax=Fibrocapsa japonica TaxID=94617 RepID=A0A7S2V3V7_9STRA|mmetsp:Transcript_5061/g.7695  ORF Transcript_5061/g.7695 Transcript_5061/m.7695 type:complete len:291 (+) Transcript_5061:2-874(+)
MHNHIPDYSQDSLKDHYESTGYSTPNDSEPDCSETSVKLESSPENVQDVTNKGIRSEIMQGDLSSNSRKRRKCGSPDEKQNRSRERNREHARKTRERKKDQLLSLQSRLEDVRKEREHLIRLVEECNTAAILLGLSDVIRKCDTTESHKDGEPEEQSLKGKNNIAKEACKNPELRQLELELEADKKMKQSSKCNGINWKDGYMIDGNGNTKKLSLQELEVLRRERNRAHAKLTRDRKKAYIKMIEQMVERFEKENKKIKQTLAGPLLRLQQAKEKGPLKPPKEIKRSDIS